MRSRIERALLEPVVNAADLVIDTSRMGVHELRELINRRVGKRPRDRMSMLFESFGFKYGIPGDADFVFDARSLPNPYWEPSLRPLTGRDEPVVHFLEAQPGVARFIEDVARFVEARMPEHQAANRRYLTVAIGCTGGQHRSVYIVEQLAARIAARWPQVAVRHSALPDSGPGHCAPSRLTAGALGGKAAAKQLGDQPVAMLALDLDDAVLDRAAAAARALELGGQRPAAAPRASR